MSDLPDLSSLSHDEKDALIRALWSQVQALTARVAELEARLGGPPKSPDNSSVPPPNYLAGWTGPSASKTLLNPFCRTSHKPAALCRFAAEAIRDCGSGTLVSQRSSGTDVAPKKRRLLPRAAIVPQPWLKVLRAINVCVLSEIERILEMDSNLTVS